MLLVALLLSCSWPDAPAGLFGWPSAAASQSNESDELSRAILATMSTQSSVSELNASLARPAPAQGRGAGPGPRAEPPDGAEPPALANGEPAAGQEPGHQVAPLLDRLLDFCRIFIMGAIIVGDICGNSLVILSVCRHSKLRVTTNWFVVSLACADILVALFAMTFNASVIISGRWLFKPWVCDFWNSCDVLASTASILHLCCISIDRYIAIMRPLDYPMKITTRRVVYALCAVWISSALLSYIPIFTGIYTTTEHIQWLKENPDQCDFVVNRVYAIVSSSISFWIPCCIMVFTYYRIYKEATRQEKFIYKAQSMMPAPVANHHHQHQAVANSQQRAKQRRSKSVAVASSGAASHEARIRNLAARQQHQLGLVPAVTTTKLTGAAPASAENVAGAECEPLTGSAVDLNNNTGPGLEPAARASAQADQEQAHQTDQDDQDERDSNSGQSTPTKRSISKMKREHKAAKTLGIIMGVFILCWLPFFSWYTPQHICGHACEGIIPRQVVTLLFWIGYFNSTLNPIIYAYFNHEFRDAFKKTLQWIFCCCQDLKCLRVNRQNDNQHYNCTYRSTQEIGLVSNS